MAIGQRGQFLSFGDVERQGLFDENVFSGIERPANLPSVQRGWRRQRDSVAKLVVQKLVERPGGNTVLSRQLGGPDYVRFAYGIKRAETGKIAHNIVAPIATSHCCNPRQTDR